jgi:ketosteroid isomerase-like protein
MASANVDLVRSVFAAWERGDYSDAKWAHPEVEYVYADGPAPGRWVGRPQQGMRAFLNAWKGFRVEAEEYRELDDERVLVLTRFRGRGKRSGVELARVGAKGAHIFHLRGGMVVKRVFYMDRDRALADLGLDPEGGAPDTERPQ